MSRRAWAKTAAFGCLALLLLAMGAALRPLVPTAEDGAPAVFDSTEIGFIQDMAAHHNQALLMVHRLDRAVDPTVLALAQQIADTQRIEIGMLLGWLRVAGAATANPRPMAWMHSGEPTVAGHHAVSESGGAMPGMASHAELDELVAARGPQARELFLRLMQRHHYGGIQMARAADELLVDGVVKQSARDMISTQSQEAGLMGLLLARP